MPSVPYSNPQSQETFNNKIPVITEFTTFLRVPINRPDLQYSHIRDLISNFHFPILSRRLPLTALRRIISQRIISRIRPYLAFQPISPSNALSLDHLLASKVHEYLGFPFRFNTRLLTAPLHQRGFAFPSISRLNSSLAMSGLQRDLNHHITPFREMAAITLADWTCLFNGCINPISTIPTPSTFKHSCVHRSKLPFAWSLAGKIIRELGLSFIETDLHYITDGFIGIRHLAKMCKVLFPNELQLPSRNITNLEKVGYKTVDSIGHFIPSLVPPLCFTFSPFLPSPPPTALRDWYIFLRWSQILPSLITQISQPSPSSLLPRQKRRQLAENCILALPQYHHSYPHTAPPDTFASDGSTIALTSNISNTNFAVVANGNAFAASISSHGSETGILHGECYGIVATSLLALHSKLPKTTLYSDHLGSVTFLTSTPQPHVLTAKPARSYYRWILDIWNDAQNNNQHISLLHCKAHTTHNTLPANMNRLADHIASHSHHEPLPPSPLPPPTFAMDNYALYSPSHGFVESNPFHFFDSLLSQQISFSLDTYHAPIIPSPLFDHTPPPAYSYLQALSSFSAVVQLYLRSGQLDTSLSLSRRLSDGSQPWCRFGCHAIEDPHHIFIQCHRFDAFRDNATSSILSSSTILLDASALNSAHRQVILERARGLFCDSDTWPAQRSLYYIGVLPSFSTVESPIAGPSKTLFTRLANDWHTISIRLAARIWSESRKRSTERNSTPRAPRKSISLPCHLESILPSSSYPSLNISFH